MQRKSEWAAVRADALVEAEQTPTGVVLSYEHRPETKAELTRLVAAEQECCAHEAIEWQLADHGDRLVVTMSVVPELLSQSDREAVFGWLAHQSIDS